MSIFSKKSTSSKKALTGLSCLPTRTRMNLAEPQGSAFYAPGQHMYVLESTDANDLGGGPVHVVLTSVEELQNVDLDRPFEPGDDIATHHFEGKKNLPSRKVVACRDGEGTWYTESGDGITKGVSLPHWEFVGAGGASMKDLEARATENKSRKPETTKKERKSIFAGV